MAYKFEILNENEVRITDGEPNGFNVTYFGGESEAIEIIKQLNITGPGIGIARAKNTVKENYNRFFDAYLAYYSKGAVASFEDKKREALAWKIDSNAITPICDGIAAGMQVSRDELLGNIYRKVVFLANQEGVLGKILNELSAAKTESELDDIDIDPWVNFIKSTFTDE